MYSVMWSEHCSYKSSQDLPAPVRPEGHPRDEEEPHGRHGRERRRRRHRRGLGGHLQGRDRTTTRRYIEPFQGAATGVGGIVRDIISMGARPVAVMDAAALRRHRPPRHRARRARRRLAASRFYGNCLGLPNIGGETWFDPVYQAQPARQRARGRRAAPRGPAPRQRPRRRQQGRAVRGPHRRRRHRRGIHPRLRHVRRRAARPSAPPCRSATRSPRRCSSSAASSCSRASWSRASRTSAPPASRAPPASSPPTATAACSSSSTKVLLRDPTLTAEEILMSESQERMMAIVAPEKLDGFLAVDGEVGCRDQRARRGHRHRPPHHQLARRGDRQRRPAHRRRRRPGLRAPGRLPDLDRRAAGRHAHPRSPAPTTADDAARPVPRSCSAAPNLADKSWITNQYDHYVLRQHRARASPTTAAWSASTRRSGLGFAIATDANGRYCQLDPYAGRAARPRRGVPQRRRHRRDAGRRHRLPQLRQPREPRGHVAVLAGRRGPRRRMPRARASRSPAATCRFYNQTGDVPIHPTPVVAVLGMIDDVARRIPSRLAGRGRQHLPARHHARSSSTARPGPASCTATSAAARPPSTSRARSALAGAAARRRRSESAHRRARTTSPTAASRRPSPRACCASASARASGSASIMRARRRRCRDRPVQRVDRPRDRVACRARTT